MEVSSDIVLTSRSGHITEIELYCYQFRADLLNDVEKHDKFITWLANNDDLLVYAIEEKSFTSFIELKDAYNRYKYISKRKITLPLNTVQISSFISYLLKIKLSKTYKQFLNKNIFIVEEIDLDPFLLYKCFEFNIEVFDSGDFIINVIPVSKIVGSAKPINHNYGRSLFTRFNNSSEANEMYFNLVNLQKFYRKRIDLLSKDYFEQIELALKLEGTFLATFDYHFVATYSPSLFGKVVENAAKELKDIVAFLDPVLSQFELPVFFNLTSDKYVKAIAQEPLTKNNLLVGLESIEEITIYGKTLTQYGLRVEFTRNEVSRDQPITIHLKNEKLINSLNLLTIPLTLDVKIEQREGWAKPYITAIFDDGSLKNFKTNTQSAAFYHGIFKSANDCQILPVLVEQSDPTLFNELLSVFNKGCINFKVLEPLILEKDQSITKNKLIERIGNQKTKTLISVLTKFNMPSDYFDFLHGFKYQIYQGDIADKPQTRPKLSNFVCRCLEKLNGIISVIHDTSLPKEGYFIGIDLGHTTFGADKFSNLAMAMFNKNGTVIAKVLEKNLPRKENLIPDRFTALLYKLAKILHNEKLVAPKHIIFHRDGKLHNTDVETITESAKRVWGDVVIDIVEIIKSGYPATLIKVDSKSVANPSSGMSFQDLKNRYAILITNAQASDKEVILNPIIIKHKLGSTDFPRIVDQVYWLTKIYTNNLYNSTRLPATTQIANNIVSTSLKAHKPSYKG